MCYLIIVAPAILWFLSLIGFLTVFKKERPEVYHELSLLDFFRRKESDDAARVINFFWYQKHLKLGGKTALAGMALNIVFCFCVIYMFVVLWLGWTGRIN